MTDVSPNAPHDAPVLHPRLAALAHELDTSRAALLAAAHAVPEAQRHRKPADGKWSVTDVLNHLLKVESSSGRLFSVYSRQLRANGAPVETETETASIIDAYTRFGMETRSRLVEAPELVAPEAEARFDDTVEALSTSRARLLAALREANGLALGTVTAPHPRLGSLTLYEWLLTIARHERRHIPQIAEIRDALSRLSTS